MGVDSPRRTFLASPATLKSGSTGYKASGNLIAAAALSASAAAAPATAPVAPSPPASAAGASPLAAGLSPHRKVSPSVLALMLRDSKSAYLSPLRNGSGHTTPTHHGAPNLGGAAPADDGLASLSLGDSVADASRAAAAAMNLLSLEEAQNSKRLNGETPQTAAAEAAAAGALNGGGSPLLKRAGADSAAAGAAAAVASRAPPTAAGATFAYHKASVRVVHPEDDADGKTLRAKLVAAVPFKKGQLIAKLEGVSWNVPCSYSTVQYGPQRHLELNSDLVYMNHSCDPTVAMNVGGMEVRAVQDIPEGGELTFFYPSSEWEMDQPFVCWCNSHKCVRLVAGAKFLSVDKLSQYFVNAHIRDIACNTLSSKLPKQ